MSKCESPTQTTETHLSGYNPGDRFRLKYKEDSYDCLLTASNYQANGSHVWRLWRLDTGGMPGFPVTLGINKPCKDEDIDLLVGNAMKWACILKRYRTHLPEWREPTRRKTTP